MLQHHSMPTNIMESADTTVDTTIITAEEDVVRNTKEIGAVAKAVGETVI